MREDVKQKHCSTPLHEASIGVYIQAPLLLRGEGFGSNAWSATEYDRDTDRSWVSLEWFHLTYAQILSWSETTKGKDHLATLEILS